MGGVEEEGKNSNLEGGSREEEGRKEGKERKEGKALWGRKIVLIFL